MVEDSLGEAWFAVGRQPHHLVFARIDPKTGKVREGGIEEAKRMREMDLLEHCDPIAVAECGRSRRPFADPIHGQNDGVLEGRRKKGRSCVTEVVFREQKTVAPIEFRRRGPQFFNKLLFLEKLVLEPDRHCGAKRLEAARGKSQVSCEQPLKFKKRLVVKGDMV